MEYQMLSQMVLTILSSIITGGFILVFIEIGNRKNRENDNYEFQMKPFMHKLSAYFRFISWCSSRICYPKELNVYEKHFKEQIDKISNLGGRSIVSGGDYGIEYFKPSELREIAEDINNIWYWHDKMHPCNLIWRDVLYESNELIDNELNEISPKYVSMPHDINLVSKISSDFYVYIYQPIEYLAFKHEANMKHFSRSTCFMSISVTVVLIVLCLMLFVKIPPFYLQLSTVFIVLLLLTSLLLLSIDTKKQIRWYNRLHDKCFHFCSQTLKTKSKRVFIRIQKKRISLLKFLLWGTGLITVICIVTMLVCNQIVVKNAEGKAFSEIDSIKYNKVGLLLGTTPQARITKVKNYFFIYRLDAAAQLYRARKIEKILISGDEHSLDGINEPECMRDSLVERGIPADDIILDGKGYRTINSVINANKVYGLKSFTIISQEFHNERALYQAEHLGLEVENLQAFNAKMPKSRRAYLTSIREYFARVKMFLDLMTYKG